MSTYAVYYVWAGITKEESDEINNSFIDDVLETYGGVERNGLTFTSIAMHGRTVGMGVQIQELNWEVDIGENNIYNPVIAQEAQGILQRVNGTLEELEIPVQAKLYHHIDLGG